MQGWWKWNLHTNILLYHFLTNQLISCCFVLQGGLRLALRWVKWSKLRWKSNKKSYLSILIWWTSLLTYYPSFIIYSGLVNTKNYDPNLLIDGFSPIQRFFLSWAQCWRQNVTKERALQLLTIDPHGPNEWVSFLSHNILSSNILTSSYLLTSWYCTDWGAMGPCQTCTSSMKHSLSLQKMQCTKTLKLGLTSGSHLNWLIFLAARSCM